MDMNSFLAEMAVSGASLPDYSSAAFEMSWNCFHDRTSRATWAAVTRCYKVRGAGKEPHTVVVSYSMGSDGQERFIGWCGDRYAEGGMPVSEKARRIAAALADSSRFASCDMPALRTKLESGFGVTGEESGGCNFWARKARGGCKHYRHVLAALNRSDLEELKAEYETVMQGAPAKPAPAASNANELDVLMKAAFRHPVLLFGPPGSGKSHMARELADQSGVKYIEFGGHEGAESAELLGCTTPFKGGWVWRDGPVTEAFRVAGKGTKVVLCLDELLRIREASRSALLSAFSEFRGRYRLRTGRIVSEEEGVGCEETLEADVGNLFLIATANVGDQYGQDGLDDALRSRFQLVHVDASEATVKALVDEALCRKGWNASESASVSKGLLDAWKKSRVGVASAALSRALDSRAIKRALSKADKAGDVKGAVMAESLQCVGLSSDGVPIKEHSEFFMKLVNSCFK